MATTIRSSNQLYVDANLDIHSNKVVSLAAGVADTDGVNMSQLNSAVANIGGAIHAPAADLTVAKAVAGVTAPTGHTDRMIMLIETLGLYRYDAESILTSNDNTVIRPTDVASDVVAGRWLKISSVLTDHNNLSALQGGTTNEYYHLTSAENTRLATVVKNTGAEIDTGTDDVKYSTAKSIRDSGLISGAVSGEIAGLTDKATPVNADVFMIEDSAATNAKKKLTWANIKTVLTTLFDGIYWKLTATGDVTITTNVTTIGTNVVTNAKAAQMATLTMKGNNTGSTANAIDLTVAQVKTMLSIGSQSAAVRTYRATPTGTVNGSNTEFTIAALVLSGTEEVFKNGMLMNAGAGNDYTIAYAATTTITFLTAPSNTPFTDVILVNYSV